MSAGEEPMTPREYLRNIERVFFMRDSSSDEEDPPSYDEPQTNQPNLDEPQGHGRRVTIRVEDNQYYSPVYETPPPLRRLQTRCHHCCCYMCGCLIPRTLRDIKVFFLCLLVGTVFVAWVLAHILYKLFMEDKVVIDVRLPLVQEDGRVL